jgi:phosphoribosylcarboxyaminoimidazole (NCAIR) mutase
MKENKLNRRQFLVAAGAGSAATATALIASKQAAPVAAVQVAAAPVQEVKGYHMSEHIAKYYKTTEI